MSKVIVIPSPVVVELAGKATQTVSFAELVDMWTKDPQAFGGSLEALYAGIAIRDAFGVPARPKLAGERVTLTDEQYGILLHAVRMPSVPYVPEVAYQVLPMIQAVTGAKEPTVAEEVKPS